MDIMNALIGLTGNPQLAAFLRGRMVDPIKPEDTIIRNLQGQGNTAPPMSNSLMPAPQAAPMNPALPAMGGAVSTAPDFSQQYKNILMKPIPHKDDAHTMDKNSIWEILAGGLASYLTGGRHKSQATQDFLQSYSAIKGQHAKEVNAQNAADEARAQQDKQAQLGGVVFDANQANTNEDNRRQALKDQADMQFAKERQNATQAANSFKQLITLRDGAFKTQDANSWAALQKAAAGLISQEGVDPNMAMIASQWGDEAKLRAESIGLKAAQTLTEGTKQGLNVANTTLADARSMKMDEDTGLVKIKRHIAELDARIKEDTLPAQERAIILKNAKTALEIANLQKTGKKIDADTHWKNVQAQYKAVSVVGAGPATSIAISKDDKQRYLATTKALSIAAGREKALTEQMSAEIKDAAAGSSTGMLHPEEIKAIQDKYMQRIADAEEVRQGYQNQVDEFMTKHPLTPTKPGKKNRLAPIDPLGIFSGSITPEGSYKKGN